MKPFKIIVPIEVTSDHIDQFLSSALEGGITYWCTAAEVIGKGADDFEGYASEAISAGLSLRLTMSDDEDCFLTESGAKSHVLTRARAATACKLYAKLNPEVFGRCIRDPGYIDAVVGDVWVQLALFGKVLFG